MFDTWGYQIPLHLAALIGFVVVAVRWNRLPRSVAGVALCGLVVMPFAAVLLIVFAKNWYSVYSTLGLDGPNAMEYFFLTAKVVTSLLHATGAALILAAFLGSRRAPVAPSYPTAFPQPSPSPPGPGFPQPPAYPAQMYPPHHGAPQG
jgi:hypothetical protein